MRNVLLQDRNSENIKGSLQEDFLIGNLKVDDIDIVTYDKEDGEVSVTISLGSTSLNIENIDNCKFTDDRKSNSYLFGYIQFNWDYVHESNNISRGDITLSVDYNYYCDGDESWDSDDDIQIGTTYEQKNQMLDLVANYLIEHYSLKDDRLIQGLKDFNVLSYIELNEEIING